MPAPTRDTGGGRWERPTPKLRATYTVELYDLGPEPDWHKDRTLFGPWQTRRVVVKNAAGSVLATADGMSNRDAWYRLPGELCEAMRWVP